MCMCLLQAFLGVCVAVIHASHLCAVCVQSLYDTATGMRERRLDCEEMLLDERKNSEVMRKAQDALQKKGRVVESLLRTAQNDLEAFQVLYACSCQLPWATR